MLYCSSYSIKIKEGYETGRNKAPWTGKHHSVETKRKLSEIRKRYLKENRNIHNWSLYRNKETQPEKLFRECLEELGIQYEQYYIPHENNRNFELDFAIVDKKLAFEINGNQHYNKDGTLKDYYKNRHDYFQNNGWSVVELHYTMCFDKKILKNIITTVA